MLNATRLTSSFVAVLLGLGAVGMAQPAVAQLPPSTQPAPAEVTDEQIDQFARAYLAVQTIQQEIQTEMVAAVEAEGLTVDEFNAMAQTLQASGGSELPPEQAESFMAAADQMATIQSSVREDMAAAIQAENLTVEEFDQILLMAQQDPSLLEQINQRLGQ